MSFAAAAGRWFWRIAPKSLLLLRIIYGTFDGQRVLQNPHREDVALDAWRKAISYCTLDGSELEGVAPHLELVYSQQVDRIRHIEQKGLALLQAQAVIAAGLSVLAAQSHLSSFVVCLAIASAVYLASAFASSTILGGTREQHSLSGDQVDHLDLAGRLGRLRASVAANTNLSIRLSNLASGSRSDTLVAAALLVAAIAGSFF